MISSPDNRYQPGQSGGPTKFDIFGEYQCWFAGYGCYISIKLLQVILLVDHYLCPPVLEAAVALRQESYKFASETFCVVNITFLASIWSSFLSVELHVQAYTILCSVWHHAIQCRCSRGRLWTVLHVIYADHCMVLPW